MSAWEKVPAADDRDWLLMDEAERETYLRAVFDELGGEQAESRLHDRDGFYAHEAGSEECLALGHVPPEDPADWEVIPGHETGWNDSILCVATKYDTACTVCEGECSYEVPKSIWSMPGVLV